MACDPNTLIDQAKCLNACIPPHMLQAVQVSLLCQIAGGGGGGGGGVTSFNARTGAVTLTLGDVSAVADARYVLKTGDSMTGKLGINIGTQAVGPGEAMRLDATFNDGGVITENFSLLTLKAVTTSGNFNEALALRVQNSAGATVFAIEAVNGAIIAAGPSRFSDLAAGFFAHEGGPLSLGFFGAALESQQVSAADLTNNVTAGGVNNTIANYTDLTIYANDSAAIRNDIYQLSRKLKQVNDGLRAYGLFT